ncbi:MAG: methyltransferase [Candidatus Korarchaeum sp.]|nr:methyltransferase [Candidatus Korarchaeum sp.]MDW8036397.1 methyltransferase [Candidatus Korarchaeum sp.]
MAEGRAWEVAGLRLLRAEGVYWPAEDSLLVLEALRPLDLRGKACLDLGTGTGILAIEMARKGCWTVASDLSLDSCLLARLNSSLNSVSVEVVQGSLVRHFRSSAFDLVVFNPPYLPLEGESEQWTGGELGRKLIDSVLIDLPRILKVGGVALILHADFNNPELTAKKVEALGMRVSITKRRKLAFHELMVVEMRKYQK